jgi:hypothetical protein
MSSSLERHEFVDTTCLAPTAACCDVIGLTCALPAVCICSLSTCGPYLDDRVPPLSPRVWSKTGNRPHFLDRWYRASIHSLHGGSLLQLIATHAAYWRFPFVRNDGENTSVHKVQVAPRTACGARCFVPMVEASDPHFRIRKDQDGTLSVRLTAKTCGCGAPSDCSAFALNDVWRVSEGGRLIMSMKTRNHCLCCDAMCVVGTATGPAMFVAADDVPTAPQILTALRD